MRMVKMSATNMPIAYSCEIFVSTVKLATVDNIGQSLFDGH